MVNIITRQTLLGCWVWVDLSKSRNTPRCLSYLHIDDICIRSGACSEDVYVNSKASVVHVRGTCSLNPMWQRHTWSWQGSHCESHVGSWQATTVSPTKSNHEDSYSWKPQEGCWTTWVFRRAFMPHIGTVEHQYWFDAIPPIRLDWLSKLCEV